MVMKTKDWLTYTQSYADSYSGCIKVKVGATIVKNNTVIGVGTNRSIPNNCKRVGCLRIHKYGDNGKSHRDPSDCRALHAEVDAVLSVDHNPIGATIYCTRYPCESCARVIVAAGIKRVVYGRKQAISEETKNIFDSYDVAYEHVPDWDADDVTE